MIQPLPLLGALRATHSAKATPARAAASEPAVPMQQMPDTVPASEEELAMSATGSPNHEFENEKMPSPASPVSSLPPSASRAGDNAVF